MPGASGNATVVPESGRTAGSKSRAHAWRPGHSRRGATSLHPDRRACGPDTAPGLTPIAAIMVGGQVSSTEPRCPLSAMPLLDGAADASSGGPRAGDAGADTSGFFGDCDCRPRPSVGRTSWSCCSTMSVPTTDACGSGCPRSGSASSRTASPSPTSMVRRRPAAPAGSDS